MSGVSEAGPYDSGAGEVPESDDALNFGPLRFRMPDEAELVEHAGTAKPRAVQLDVPAGRVSLSVLAAPRSAPLWPEMVEEIASSHASDGAQVVSEQGRWGRELQAISDGELSWFIGVDGPRWMLYGEATGPVEGSAKLAAILRELLRGSVVTRGPEPLPARTALSLIVPPEPVGAARDKPGDAPAASSSAETLMFRLGPTPSPGAKDEPGSVRQRQQTNTAPREPMEPRSPMEQQPRRREAAAAQWQAAYHGAALPVAERAPVNGDGAHRSETRRPELTVVRSTEAPSASEHQAELDREDETVPAGAASVSSHGRSWATPGMATGLTVGIAGLVLVLGGAGAWATMRGPKPVTQTPSAATPPPTTALTNPGPAQSGVLPPAPGSVPGAPVPGSVPGAHTPGTQTGPGAPMPRGPIQALPVPSPRQPSGAETALPMLGRLSDTQSGTSRVAEGTGEQDRPRTPKATHDVERTEQHERVWDEDHDSDGDEERTSRVVRKPIHEETPGVLGEIIDGLGAGLPGLG
ncbi:DUF3710 domain-containing protein [Pseudonocardia spinosispora]|uniref:DUF3710 domain-containing protein n=1 Tax=Pseudonocardia spinosispora TaxID=103441 RepID=UPI00041BAD44|nr:DUF3710 domain-containing protein [Pseudonocardia spinosispora]